MTDTYIAANFPLAVRGTNEAEHLRLENLGLACFLRLLALFRKIKLESDIINQNIFKKNNNQRKKRR
jgi:hypothetical protein